MTCILYFPDSLSAEVKAEKAQSRGLHSIEFFVENISPETHYFPWVAYLPNYNEETRAGRFFVVWAENRDQVQAIILEHLREFDIDDYRYDLEVYPHAYPIVLVQIKKFDDPTAYIQDFERWVNDTYPPDERTIR